MSKKDRKAYNFRSILRGLGIWSFGALILLTGIWFVYAALSAGKVQNAASLSCSFILNQNVPFSYIQYNIKDQAIEPFFRGSFFIDLGDIPTGPPTIEVVTTAGRQYGNTVTRAEFFRDEPNKAYWMKKESEEIPIIRMSGSHRDFPFDSATIDFNTSLNPGRQLGLLMVRNMNPSFYIPCSLAKVTFDSSGTIHVHFEMRRNPTVLLMATVILLGAALFVLIIPFAVKQDALPTSIASFFFSIWSIRGILSSEMKVFPTDLDIIILFLCVLLLLLIGIRFLVAWIRHSTPRAAT